MTKAIPPKNLVLYADDDPDDIDLIKDAFSIYPAVDLATFSDGQALLIHAESLPVTGITPCLIILDINMPRMNGKQALIRLRNLKEYSEVPIVLFSTSTLATDAEFAKRFNAAFITKPLHVNQINQMADIFLQHCADGVRSRIKGYKTK